MVVEVDLNLLKVSKLNLEEFFTLCLINQDKPINDYYNYFGSTTIQSLVNNLWIKKLEDNSYALRAKSKELFKPKVNINFDEFWDVFPTTTPSGRILRASSKMWGNKPTRDYEVCKKKYLSKLKSVEAHKQIVSIVKARVASKDYEYMNNIETYINQQKWQQDVKYLTQNSMDNTINKLVE